MKKLIILIPVYKPIENLDHLEKVSIRNTVEKFNDLYSIALLNSDKVSVQSYIEYFRFNFLNFQFSFSTWAEYNALLKEPALYEKVENFEFMLIVQTDAYIFSNDLTAFFQYDYVGAPWTRDPIKKIKGCVGNGGFSLRNIQKIKSILISNKRLIGFKSLLYINFKHAYKYGNMHRFKGFKKFTIQQLLSISVNTIFQYFFVNKFKTAFKLDSVIEDVFYGVLIPAKFRNFKVSDADVALRFSIDENPVYFFKKNNRELPIGCHAFIKNYQIFWKYYIQN